MMQTAKPIVSLDLRCDLPKVREQYAKLLNVLPTGTCDYTAPCVVGAMVPPTVRGDLQEGDKTGSTAIGDLIRHGLVEVPPGQKRDFTSLQRAFDSADLKRFERTLARVESKYLTAAPNL